MGSCSFGGFYCLQPVVLEVSALEQQRVTCEWYKLTRPRSIVARKGTIHLQPAIIFIDGGNLASD